MLARLGPTVNGLVNRFVRYYTKSAISDAFWRSLYLPSGVRRQ